MYIYDVFATIDDEIPTPNALPIHWLLTLVCHDS